jgi:hypothetical protein
VVNYTVVLYNVIGYVIGNIRDVNIVANRAIVNKRIINSGWFGNAAVKTNLLVEPAKLDWAGKGSVFYVVRLKVRADKNLLPVAALTILRYKLVNLGFGQCNMLIVIHY